ncbi:glycosyltransferase [Aeromonas salmonicida]|uniref:glycosyltransferase n=1 Tax=Aeromonas salmonicida TaxID=645 RepID=UPI002890209C|nr:glycosyltransferase [Aeromonas salmonicida]
MSDRVAVAMSIYYSDPVEYVSIAIESILNQSYQNVDLFIQVDGMLPDCTYKLLSSYASHPNIFIDYDDENKGLAYRLNQIIDKILILGTYKYVARMDADDISRNDRIEKQVAFFNRNANVDVIGSDVIEIDGEGSHLFYKKMSSSHQNMLRNIIKKCPFNHPSVMFKVSLFIEGFRYKSWLKNTQDYYLWIDLLAKGKIFSNLNEPLLFFRVDDAFHQRRGWRKAVNDFNSRMYAFKNLDVISVSNFSHVVMLFILRLSPAFIKKTAYKFLR